MEGGLVAKAADQLSVADELAVARQNLAISRDAVPGLQAQHLQVLVIHLPWGC